MALLTYDLTFVDNTPEQCTIRNKQITAGNAKFSPTGDQIINNQGGKKLLQVVATSASDVSFEGTFELQLMSMTFECSFSYAKGQGAKFEAKPLQKGQFSLKYDRPSIEGSVATLEVDIIVTP